MLESVRTQGPVKKSIEDDNCVGIKKSIFSENVKKGCTRRPSH